MGLFSLPTEEQRRKEPGVFGDGLTLYGNVFIRRFVLRAGEKVGGHAHRFDHLSLLIRGKMAVRVGEVTTEYSAPHEVVMPKLIVHELTALEDNTIWLCIFAIRGENGEAVENIYESAMDPSE